MVVKIGDVSVSIPTAIDKWAHESDDNMTEFNGMIESLMYAVNKVMKTKYSMGPYTEIYNEQLKALMELGLSQEEADESITRLLKASKESTDKLDLSSPIVMDTIKNLFK
jgi:Holliday junction resolvasome RuvABC DNA-binding subunit